MVTPRPLKLKRELGRVGVLTPASDLPIAKVWVDTGVFHLDDSYDYLVPEKYSDQVQVGVRVEVEFGKVVHEGLVIERSAKSDKAIKPKQISRVLSPHPVATTETISLILHASKRWAGVPYDIIRSAIPPRVASVDKEFFHSTTVVPTIDLSESKQVRVFWALPPAKTVGESLLEFIHSRNEGGQILILCSTERELREIESQLVTVFPSELLARLDATSTRADRYRNFLRITQGSARIGLGLRGAAFTPLRVGSTIVVVSESSENLHEPRTPGWNARDVALLRSSLFNTNVLLMGFTPSLEVARLLETKWLTEKSSGTKRTVLAHEQSQGSLLPSKAFPVIRKALTAGPVLCLVPRKGYGNAVLCAKCRNVAQCSCGARLSVGSKSAAPECAFCSQKYDSWRCSYCQSSEIYLVARGIDRFVEEIGRAFPQQQVLNSSGENIIDEIDLTHGLVVATPGAEPRYAPGYAAVILLEGMRFFGTSDIRATERSREQFFVASHLGSENATTFVTLNPVHPIVAALTRWDAMPMVRRELTEQESAHLPPYFRFISLEVEGKEALQLHAGMSQALESGRIPITSVIRGPYLQENLLSRITLTAPVSDAPLLVSFVHELQRKRSIARKSLLRIRVDPYSLA